MRRRSPICFAAATAEKGGLAVLAACKDFDLIAEITSQAIDAVA